MRKISNTKLTGKIIVEGKLRNQTPLIIGSRVNERADIQIIRNSEGFPIIPGTSIAGVIGGLIRRYMVINSNFLFAADLIKIWGSDWLTGSNSDGTKIDSSQSLIHFHDAIAESSNVSLRDGICIDPKRGIAKDKSKFNYEIVEKGTLFSFKIEFSLIRDLEDKIKTLFLVILHSLKDDQLQFGAKTRNGFGIVRLLDESINYYDFNKRSHFISWLKQRESPDPFSIEQIQQLNKFFRIEGQFEIIDSLIVKSYSGNISDADSVQLANEHDFVIPSSSLKGIIRSRMEKILKTLDISRSEEYINDIFGIEESDKKKGKAGSIIVHESYISKDEVDLNTQTRISVDRFTGGTLTGALYESMPIWNRKDGNSSFKIIVELEKGKNSHIGLLLLVFKDLWDDNLPIGGEIAIGRGRIKGKQVKMYWGDNEVIINKKGMNLEIIPEQHKQSLNDFVSSIGG